MNRHIALLALILGATGCSSQDDQQPNAHYDGTARNDANTSDTTANLTTGTSPEDQAGMFRWSSGMQMGIFWAAVGNKEGDTFRLTSDEDVEGNFAGWEPTVEFSDEDRLAKLTKGQVLNFIVGKRAWVFPYEVDIENQATTPTPMSGSGHSDMSEFLSELQTTDADIICVEFPDVDYKTCFSTVGMKEAVANE